MRDPDRFSVAGRKALITGASRGIGRAIALGLAQAGADVLIHCAGRVELAQQTAAEAMNHGVAAHVAAADLASVEATRRLYDETLTALSRVDILVLNASLQIRSDWDEITPEQFDLQMQTNLRSSLQLIQLAAPPMLAAGWGRILVVGSVQQVKPNPTLLAYAASKCGLTALVRGLAKPFAGRGVTINNLAPGVIETDRNADALADPAIRQRVLSWIPAGFAGQPEDCVGPALLLCSDAGRYITGVDLLVDGGMGLP